MRDAVTTCACGLARSLAGPSAAKIGSGGDALRHPREHRPDLEPGAVAEERAAAPHAAKIGFHPCERGDVGRVARKHPGAHRHAVAGHRERDDDLGVVVATLLAVAAFAPCRDSEPAPFSGGDVLVVGLEPDGGRVVEDEVDAAPEELGLARAAVLGEDVAGAVVEVSRTEALTGWPVLKKIIPKIEQHRFFLLQVFNAIGTSV